MPSSYIGIHVRISIPSPSDSPIWQALAAAGAKLPSAPEAEAPFLDDLSQRLSELAKEYLQARVSAVADVVFRRELKLFQKKIADFMSVFPMLDSPILPSIVEHWKKLRQDYEAKMGLPFGGVPHPGWLMNPGDWRFVFPGVDAFAGLEDGLRSLQHAVNALAKEEGAGERTGRPSYRVDHQFVSGLAQLFKGITGQPPRKGGNVMGADGRTRTAGYFAIFVKAVEDELVQTTVAGLTTQPVKTLPDRTMVPMTQEEAEREASVLRLRGMDNLIRAADDGASPAREKSPRKRRL